MNVYPVVVRLLVVGLTGVVIIEGTPVGQRLKSRLTVTGSRHELLYSRNSPFQSPEWLSDETLPLADEQAVGKLQPLDITVSEQPKEEFTHTVKKGATLSSLWKELKGAPGAVHSFIAAFSAKHPKLRAGEVFSVKRIGDEVVEVRRELGAGATLVIAGDGDAGYVPRIEQAALKTRERKVSGTIYSSLVDAARGVDLPYEVIDNFVDLFSSRVEFRKDLQSGDSFTVLFDQTRTEDGRIVKTGEIKAASLLLQGEMYAVVRDVAPDGTVRYFDEKGEMPTKSFLRYPVQFTRISSMFSTARFHPILHVHRPHNGVDFAAPIGTPVRTVGDGLVTFSGYTKSTGYMVKIAHDSRYTTEYMHLQKISPDVKKGARVTRGSVIGALGNTGLSSGPHLHFGLFDKGVYVDPMKAKIIQSTPAIKAPKAVMAMIAQMRKTHRKIAVAAASTHSAKKKA
jgi:murein DD-endopeptidase MepM/ murein hydrolase activator NlpD